ncbi:fatty acyl-CoA reductase wat-like [Acyrthosiphon pisum]|uniref:Fatty acyl-CoA reductase n=1 Tax=Acyrthosiphon pisum TaxID=7029 RepID=A0A8R2JSL9_ACYPI|nr:fatty acyl-CoA reductase wat-like [Acyrthosiphon pisum]|eukprot:XP_016657211.1 PREDICTED: fatty acyl-CoA reductase 1-like [Acyrthosiphon pisum]
MEESIPAESFRNGTIFVTGSTGFLGKILTEKLLRSCSMKKIALLVRSKKRLNSSQRVADICNQSMFDRLRIEKPDFMTKIKIIDGDLEQPSLGLSPRDHDWLIENVNFVFHCAATIKFNETLPIALSINIQGTENLLELATKMNNLKGFVHVSTAYSHCPRSEINEQFYPVSISAKELKKLIKRDENTHNVSVDWPNTYTFTKALIENVISTNENKLPISIFRPSIIGCTKSEPEPGWVDNMNGVSGIISPLIVGILRTVQLSTDKISDIVPVDYTVNALISVMWDTVNRHRDGNKKNKEPKIYNYVSSVESSVHWEKIIQYTFETYHQVPPLESMWYIFCIFSANRWVVNILRFFLHRIPGALVDLSFIIRGENPKMLKIYKKIENMTDLLKDFTTCEWKFDNSNTRELWSSLSQEDRKTFWFSFEEFDWKSYIQCTVYGIRKHILHEDLSNTTRALSKNRKLFWLHLLCIFLIIYIVFQVYWMFMT